MMARGFDVVKSALEADRPRHSRRAAGRGRRDPRRVKRDNTLALLSWMMDEKKPGATARDGPGRHRRAKKLMRKLLGEKFADPEDIKGLVKRYKPEGFTDWQPLEGQHLFTAKTVSEHVLDMFVSKLNERGISRRRQARARARAGQIRPQLVVGGDRYTMVIPTRLPRP
jgi:hypothetical protein